MDASSETPTGSPTEHDPLLGQELVGTYRIVRKIGAGGMGSVYEAKHARLPKRFAIKVLMPEWAADKVNFERFRREAETTSSLGNDHITEVVDFNFLPDGAPFMVMEYLEGEDLGARLERDGPLSPRRAASIVGDVASALTSAHARGILHRDIKPANIFLTRRSGGELVKLLDFGASKSRVKRQEDLTASGQVIGTPWYMSPEQARGQELDARSDQFSLAVVLYETLTGKLPFDAEDPTSALFKICDDPHTPIRSHKPELPQALEALFEKAFSKEPEGRFASVAALASEAHAILDKVKLAKPSAMSASVAPPTMVRAKVAAPEKPAKKPSPKPENESRYMAATEAAAPAVQAEATRVTEDDIRSVVAPRPIGPIIIAVIITLGVAVGVGYALMPRSATEPPPKPIDLSAKPIQPTDPPLGTTSPTDVRPHDGPSKPPVTTGASDQDGTKDAKSPKDKPKQKTPRGSKNTSDVKIIGAPKQDDLIHDVGQKPEDNLFDEP